MNRGPLASSTTPRDFGARNDPIGAWQYPIPAGASEETVDWMRFLGPAPDRPYDPLRIFRWRNYRDYGTGVAGDLFVHLFSSLHFVVSPSPPPPNGPQPHPSRRWAPLLEGRAGGA